MTIRFSEESKLLLGNWEAYQDVLKADRRLRTELQQAVGTIQSRLRKSDFWNSSWHFQPSSSQIYIWHDNWKRENETLIWIGVENASLEGILCDGEPASGYVWVSKSQATTLVDELRMIFNKNGTEGHGEVTTGKSSYVLQQDLPKCLPEDIDRFESAFLEPLTTFITHYARCEPIITKSVQEYIKTLK